MTTNHTPESRKADAVWNDDLVDAPGERTAGDSRELRMLRILDLQDEYLRKEDPLEACLGALSGWLMEMADCLAESIITNVSRQPGNLEVIDQMLPTFAVHAKTVDQIRAFSELALKASESATHGVGAAKQLGKKSLSAYLAGPPKRRN